jgi:TldD protein
VLSRQTIDRIIDLGLELGSDFVEVYQEDTRHNNITALHDRVESSSCGREQGVGLRIFSGLNSRYAYTTDDAEENLIRLMRKMAQSLIGPQGTKVPLRDLTVYGDDHPVKVMPHTVSYDRRMEVIRRATAAGMAYAPEIVQVSVRYLDLEQQVLIANSEGVYAEDSRVKTRVLINAYAQNEKGLQNGYFGPGAMQGFEYYDTLDIEWYAREAARTAVTMLNADRCPGGQMSVVVDNGFGGLLFHEACGHSLEASSVAKGTSEFSGKLGQQIASPLVTLIDDGTIRGEWGSLSVDDEGQPTQKNILIENGILKGYLIDKLNGRRLGMEPTGSARRQSYRFAPTSRMTNTYIANGPHSKEEIIASTERGLFVKYINGGSVNPATGDFNFNVSEAYLIEGGKLTKPVRGATLIGNGGNILKQVDMVGDNLEIRQGYCYAGSGALFIGAGQPTVRVAAMTVGGAE